MNTRLRQLLRPTDDGGAIHTDKLETAIVTYDRDPTDSNEPDQPTFGFQPRPTEDTP